MKKILVKSCNDCPLPDEPEKMKGKIYIYNYKDVRSGKTYYEWYIQTDGMVLERQNVFKTKKEARADAIEWAEKEGL